MQQSYAEPRIYHEVLTNLGGITCGPCGTLHGCSMYINPFVDDLLVDDHVVYVSRGSIPEVCATIPVEWFTVQILTSQLVHQFANLTYLTGLGNAYHWMKRFKPKHG